MEGSSVSKVSVLEKDVNSGYKNLEGLDSEEAVEVYQGVGRKPKEM